jgi:hypothetical protein
MNRPRTVHTIVGAAVICLVGASLALSNEPCGFDTDPQWDALRNRLIPEPASITRQNFGWRPTQLARGKAPGEVGGFIQRSLTPASYAQAIPEKTLNDRLTASGRFTVTRENAPSGMLFGWFHDTSRGWRTPNSIGFRLDGNGGKYWILFEYGTSQWRTGGGATFEGRYQTTKTKPFLADGRPHDWSMTYDPSGHDGDGELTFTIDGKSYPAALEKGHKADGAKFNRFGFWNVQVSGDGLEMYVDDLVLDGRPQDFSTDPGWVGVGNHVEFADRAIRPLHDFGFSRTNHAGGQPGEIGGIIWRDDKPAFYGDRTKRLTLDDELEASGRIAFLAAGSDSGVRLGWFDSETLKTRKRAEYDDPLQNFLGIMIEGPSRIGHYVRANLANCAGQGGLTEGPIIRPDGKPHRWTLTYRLQGEGGRIRVALDDAEQMLDVTPEQRQRGATFDHFGFVNVMAGGHFVEVYVDDVRFSSR